MMDFKGKKVVVAGLKKTGAALCAFLAERGARVVATDTSVEKDLEDALGRISRLAVRLELGGHRLDTFEGADLIILSPGVPHTIAPVKSAQRKGVPVMGELELAYRNIDAPIVAVTGTNGKTTTTELIGDMFRLSGKRPFVGGNIGTPLIEYVNQKVSADVIVAEISSFQLDTISSFRPDVGILLNITDDHLDRYNGFDEYVASKMRLFSNQGAEDIAVLDPGATCVTHFLNNIRSKILNFKASRADEHGAVIHENRIECRLPGAKRYRVDVGRRHLMGRHNMENISAACLGALAAGCSVAGIKAAVENFRGLAHRLEYVDTVNDALFYDDSKATNVDAVIKAIDAFNRPVVLIIGGRDKGGDFSLLREALRMRVKQLIVMGEAKDVVLSVLGNVVPTAVAGDMAEAVGIAAQAAAAGDVVLLSPGCASFDMYNGYAHRGEDFKREVGRIGGKRHAG